MKLLTKQIEKLLIQQHKKHLPDNTRESKPYCKSDPVVVKYFTPDANATWYILEGTPILDHPACSESDVIPDWYMYGLCDTGQGFREYGDILLSQLQSIRGRLGLPVERDQYYNGTYEDLKNMSKVY
jgi:hypothetical protein